jgi:hypothetical protein
MGAAANKQNFSSRADSLAFTESETCGRPDEMLKPSEFWCNRNDLWLPLGG